jgi:hypothetical protein
MEKARCFVDHHALNISAFHSSFIHKVALSDQPGFLAIISTAGRGNQL